MFGESFPLGIVGLEPSSQRHPQPAQNGVDSFEDITKPRKDSLEPRNHFLLFIRLSANRFKLLAPSKH